MLRDGTPEQGAQESLVLPHALDVELGPLTVERRLRHVARFRELGGVGQPLGEHPRNEVYGGNQRSRPPTPRRCSGPLSGLSGATVATRHLRIPRRVHCETSQHRARLSKLLMAGAAWPGTSPSARREGRQWGGRG